MNNTTNAKSHSHAALNPVIVPEDVNCKDEDGRTLLHKAVAANNVDLVRTLLAHPKTDVNERDLESGWTALHRALYLGHLHIAILLIQHKDTNMAIEDKDKFTAMDLFQATVPGYEEGKPRPADALYTWGSNANFTLGHSDADDRKMPELVKFPYQTNTITFPKAKTARPILHQLSMSKYHTAIATSEPGFSAKLWGFGTSGRLGSDNKMQLRPKPVSGIPGNITFTALGRDHTVLITAKGEVYTLGNNKYGQLGYASEATKNGQDPVQYSPKRVILSIAKLAIVGAAASKWHTVVHTETELFTFGFNYGQLGYERKGDIQLGPRKVASIPPGQIKQVQASETATACLVISKTSRDVIVFYKYAYHKVSFSLFPYPDWFSTLNQPIVLAQNRPQKIVCSENRFGMMTEWGDIHVWSYPEADAGTTLGTIPPNYSIPYASITLPDKPRRVWTYGGDRTHAIDFALGHNGSIVVLTKGGHVYIGTNKGNSVGRNVKWQRVPHLDRIVQVYGNPSGAWAALRSESALTPVIVRSSSLGSDLERSLFQFHLYRSSEKKDLDTKAVDGDDDDDDVDSKEVVDPWRIDTQGWQGIEKNWDQTLVSLLDTAAKFRDIGSYSPPGNHLFDVELQAAKRVLGAHRIVLAARSPIFQRAFVETPRVTTKVGTLVTVVPNMDESTGSALYTVMLKVEFTTAVLLLQFLYSDRFDPFWDALDLPKANKQYALKVRQELYHLALELSLPTLQAALQYSFTHVCTASLAKNMEQVIADSPRFRSMADVQLLLKDGASIYAHQTILGYRSPFFHAMFVRTNEWIRARQGQMQLPNTNGETKNKILEVKMEHMDLEAMTLAIKYMYTDCGPDLFYDIEKDEMDDLIQVVLNVLQIADELLMDRLKEICEHVLGEQVRPKTVVNFLEFSLKYAAEWLKATCIDYLCLNIEMALDQRWLEGVDDDILILIENALKGKQDGCMPHVRSGRHLPNPQSVEEMNEVIKRTGHRYFRPRCIYNVGESKSTRDIHEREKTSSSHPTLAAQEHASPSSNPANAPSIWSPPTEPPVTGASDDRSSLQENLGGTSITEWPTLSDAPTLEPRDIPSLPRKGWGHIPSAESVQPTRDGQDVGVKDGTPKPSLRDILEREARQEQPNSTKVPAPVQKGSKLSQKERRKLQQQSSAPADQPETPQPVATPQAWAKVPSANDVNLMSPDSPGSLLRRSSTGGTNGTPSLLDIQQSELALFRAQSKDVPRVTVATSKPVKETMRTSGSEKAYTEAPWRMDAIPEPLRAVTKHQNPKPSPNSNPVTSQATNGQPNDPLNDTNASTASLAVPSALASTLLSGLSPLSSLSSFAIIQNQQLRDRNMLLQARHAKKSLHQIQIEEQALAQIRMMSLDRVRAKGLEGTGEWFTCEIGLSPS